MRFEAIIAIVTRGKADHIVDEAKVAGAKGATILFARGTGMHEARKFLGMTIDSSKEAIIILAEEEYTPRIFDAVIRAGHLEAPGTGICFTMPVTRLVGLAHREDCPSHTDHEA